MIDPIDSLILKVREHYDADIVTYIGGIYSPADTWIPPWMSSHNSKRNNILLMLRTTGGSPDVAFRIARQFQIHYDTGPKDQGSQKRNFIVYVGKECKSAGTLIAVGADKLLMSDSAELGPLDVQLIKQDEVGERTSGLAPIQALGSLRTQAVEHFKDIFTNLRFDSDLMFSTKMAADIATRITIGLMNSIYAQIDPVRMSEIERQLNIASAYGERLSRGRNLKKGALGRLLAAYPSHGFVIDRDEASELFTQVESPSPELAELFSGFCSFTEDHFSGKKQPFVLRLTTQEERDKEKGGPTNV